VVDEEFGSDDFRCAMNDLLDLKQTGTVEEYTVKFQKIAVQHHHAQPTV
jgi:hypothetical protein